VGDLPALESDFRVVMTVERYDETVAFYRDTLRFPVVTAWEDEDPPGTLLRAGGGTVEISAPGHRRSAQQPTGFSLMVRVPDPDALHERLRADGVEIVAGPRDRPWGYRDFEVADPNGVKVIFYAVVVPEAAGHT
jgi:lactoylglutathione lyase